jgi:hypothetical protein
VTRATEISEAPNQNDSCSSYVRPVRPNEVSETAKMNANYGSLVGAKHAKLKRSRGVINSMTHRIDVDSFLRAAMRHLEFLRATEAAEGGGVPRMKTEAGNVCNSG